MITTQLRIAGLNDLDFLETLEKRCFPLAIQSDRRSLRLSLNSKSQEVWLAELEEDGVLISVGAMILHIHPKSIRIYSIAVLPEHQGKGAGDILLRHAISTAHHRGLEQVSLEADSGNESLVRWYSKHGFIIERTLPDYYSPGTHAVKMFLPVELIGRYSTESNVKAKIRNLIVVEQKVPWLDQLDFVDVVFAEDYISNPYYQKISNARVFNLCNSYRYQSIGYYVSLLAAAREHRAIPNVTTIRDFSHVKIVRSISEDIEELIQTTLEPIKSNTFSMKVFLGHTAEKGFSRLAKELYNLFESPFIQVFFIRHDNWTIKKIVPLHINSIKDNDINIVQGLARQYFSQKRFNVARFKSHPYNLAILINPDEKNPPSCPEALQRFKKAAEETGFYTEFITRKDYNRICEYDALFIRETTDVSNYTYQFSRYAYAEGLVVIDDPWSILRCSNKMYLNERMHKGRIHIPKSWLLMKSGSIKQQIQGLVYPIILKKPDSCFSLGVYKVNNREELLETLKVLFSSSDLVIAQEYIRSDFDWRIGIMDGKPLFASKYYMAKDHWQIYNWNSSNINNLAGDFETVPIDAVPPAIVETALKGSSFIGDGLYGVDLKYVDGKVYLIEINDNPNIDADIEDAVLKDDLYRTVMQSFLSRIERARNIPRNVSIYKKTPLSTPKINQIRL